MTKEEKLSKIGNFCILNARVLLDENLTDFEKLLYSLLNSLSSGHGYAWASDDYLADILNKSVRTVSRSLAKLESLEYIKRETLSLGLCKGSERKIYTQESLNLKGHGLAKNGESRVAKNGKSRVAKNGDSLINNIINNTNKGSELSKIEKVKERVMQIARENKYKMSKVALELSKIHDLAELKTYEKRIINKEMK